MSPNLKYLAYSDYFKAGPFMFVRPYEFFYSAYVKRRWINKSLISLYESEFNSFPVEYFEKKILCGKITVNGKKVSPEYKLQDSDYIKHDTHRHESPVKFEKLEIVFENDFYIVVDKQSSIPVHACGKYTLNSLQYVIRKFNNIDVFPIHRIDCPTSGIVIFSKTRATAKSLNNELEKKKVKKKYLARVEGNFPEGITKVDLSLICVNFICKKFDVLDSNEKNENSIPENPPKSALTIFKKVKYDEKSNTSLVKCSPITGRTHQIRVHLRSLGFPIANDFLYNSNYENFKEDIDLEWTEADFENFKLETLKGFSAECEECLDFMENPKSHFKSLISRIDKIWLHSYCYEIAGEIFKSKKPEWVAPFLDLNK